jgi:site-specific DNA-adenine methylase
VFNYFGSKARLAPTYQAPRHDLIIEPFAGAAGYSMYWLARRSDLRAVLYDINPLVVQLWQRLLAMSPPEIASYPIPKEGQESNDLLWASVASATSSWNAITNRGSFQVTEWVARDFPEQRLRLADTRWRVGDRVSVYEDSYICAPDTEATWFIDPPYQKQGKRYRHNGSDLDFTALGGWCQNRRGQVIVCEANPAGWLPFERHRIASTQVNGSQVELVWYSHPEPTLLELMR